MDNYDSLAQSYKQYGRHAVTDWVLGYHKVYGLIAPVVGSPVLDFGCGDGKFARYLAERGAIVTGVDISQEMIDVAKKSTGENQQLHYEHITFPWNIKDIRESFEVVTCNFVTCTIPNKDDLLELFRKFYLVTKDHGRVVLMNANWEQANGKEFISYSLEHYDTLTSGMPVQVHLKGPEPITVNDTYWSTQDYIELLQQAGFGNVVCIEPVANDDAMYHWKDELHHSPLLIISATK